MMTLSTGSPARLRFGLFALLVVAVLLPLSLDIVTGNSLTTKTANADTLWTLGFLRDLFIDGGRLADWSLAQHTDLFPDKLFAALAFAISSRPELWLLVFEALNLTLYFAIAWYCLGLYVCATGRQEAPWSVALWGALLVTALPPFLRSWGIFDNYFRYIGTPSNHFGPFFCAILAAFVAIDCFERELTGRTIGRLSLVCLLMLLVALSDRLTILVAVPGTLAAATYVMTIRRVVSPTILICCVAFCAAAALAYMSNDPIWNRITELTPAVPNIDPGRFKRQFGLILESLFTWREPAEDLQSLGVNIPQSHEWYGFGDFVRHLDPVRVASCGAVVGFAIGLAIVYLRRAVSGLLDRRRAVGFRVAADAFIVYLVATTFLLPVGLIAAGVIYSSGVELYLYPAAYCILWAATARLGDLIRPGFSGPHLALGTGATGLLLSAMPVTLSAPPFEAALKPPLASCLEEFGKTLTLRLGVGSHWETYPVEFWSQPRIIVRSVGADARIWHWINNYEWYAPPTDGRLFTFVIAGPDMDEPALGERIGEPTEVLDCASLGPGFSKRKILYYDRAGAERLTGRITDQYRKSEHR